jgi:hypothetical protein
MNNTVKISSTGVFQYNFVHGVYSADSVSYTPSITKDLYTKLTPSMSSHESDGITFAGDTLTILTAGDYFINISVVFSGTNANDIWRIKIYKNNIPLPSSAGRFVIRTTGAGTVDNRSYFWYLIGLSVNDNISFRITNQTASRNPTFTDMKIYIEKKPE